MIENNKDIKGYAGDSKHPEKVLEKLLDLGGHNNLHIKCDNPNKIYYLLPNKTISCKWKCDMPDPILQKPKKDAFNYYIINNVSLLAYNLDKYTIWNPGVGPIYLSSSMDVERLPARESSIRDFLKLADALGYVYVKSADAWKYKISINAPCYYKESANDLYWKIGVFLGYDDNGYGIIDRSSCETMNCRALWCVPYKSKFLNNKDEYMDFTIDDALVNHYAAVY